MSLEDLKTMSKDKLEDRLLELRKQQLNLRFRKTNNAVEDFKLIRNGRKDIARCKTLLNQLLKKEMEKSSK